MADRVRYLELSDRLREFLGVDAELSSTVSARRRLVIVGRAVNDAESGISRLDPLFSEIRALYVDALFAAKPRSGWLRNIVGTAIQEACETHGPDASLVDRLRSFRRRAYEAAGKPIDRKVEQAERTLARLRADATWDRRYVSAVYDLAGVYEKAGRYDEMISAYDGLMRERARLDGGEDYIARQERLVAEHYQLYGEMARAVPLLRELYAGDEGRRRPDVSFDDLIDGTLLHVSLARCCLATGQPGEAEAVLRESLPRLRRHDDRLPDRRYHQLLHRCTYELGSALWKQGRAGEAMGFFEDAHALVAGPKFADQKAAVVYHSAIAYGSL